MAFHALTETGRLIKVRMESFTRGTTIVRSFACCALAVLIATKWVALMFRRTSPHVCIYIRIQYIDAGENIHERTECLVT